jgi:hypothetical protein
VSARDASGAAGAVAAAVSVLRPKELLLAKTDHRLEPVDLNFELGLAFKGSGVHGLPVGGLMKRLEILIQPRANRTWPLRRGWSGSPWRSTRRLTSAPDVH